MGKLLKGIRSNLLNNKKNSFNIGFSNRSPFSYQLPSADPNSGVTPVEPPDMDNFGVEAIQAQSDAAVAATKAFGETASAAITEAKKQYSDKDIAKEKAERLEKKEKRKSDKLDRKKKRIANKQGVDVADIDISKTSRTTQKRVGRIKRDVSGEALTDSDSASYNKDKKWYEQDTDSTKQTKSEKLRADIAAGEYSDVSDADVENAEKEKNLAIAEWEKENPGKASYNKQSDKQSANQSYGYNKYYQTIFSDKAKQYAKNDDDDDDDDEKTTEFPH